MSETSNRHYLRWDHAVTFAEGFLDRCDGYRNQLAHISFWGGVSLATLVLVHLLTFFSHPFPGWSDHVLIAAAYVYAVLAWYHLYCKRARVYQHLRRDTRSLNMMVDMLREVLPTIQSSGMLAGVEKEQLRIRLARFAIGPGRQKIENHEVRTDPPPPADHAAEASLPRIQTKSSAQ